MAHDITFSMIKPGAVKAGHTGAILKMIEDAGFSIVAMKKTWLSKEQAKQFYAVHKERPFYDHLTSFMSESPIIALVLQKDNAVQDYRKLIGATNPENAEPGTIRKLFAQSLEQNAVHGADSDENAQIEASFFFSKTEIYTNEQVQASSEVKMAS